MRAHAHLDTKRREPYLLPEENMQVVKATLRKRYSYLPLWYTLFHESETTGMPILRALWMEFPKEADRFETEDSYLVGKFVYVLSCASVDVYW